MQTHPPTQAITVLRPAATEATTADADSLTAPGTSPDDTLLGQQLTEQFHSATRGMVEVLKFGVMMMRLRANLLARGQVSKGGRGHKGEGLEGWLQQHAPGVVRQTAQRFEAIAQAVEKEYATLVGAKIAKAFTLPDLVTTPADDLPEPARAKQMELFDYVCGTSQRSLLDKFRAPSPKGGKTYERDGQKGQHLQPTASEEMEIRRARLIATAKTLADIHKGKDWICLTDDAELDGFIDHVSTVAAEVIKWSKLSKTERAAAMADYAAQLAGR